MAAKDKEPRSRFNKRLVARTRQIREDLGYSREEMADLLGVSYHSMQRYEDRTPMPHYYLTRFCEQTGFDPWYVMTGQPKFEKPPKK